MPSDNPIKNPRSQAPTEDNPPVADLVVIHQCTVLHAGTKGWRTTVRVQDGWQGATLSMWSRGGSSVQHGEQKAVDDHATAYQEALGYLQAF